MIRAFDQSFLEDAIKHQSLISPSSPVNNAGSNLSFLPFVGDVQKALGSQNASGVASERVS